MSGVLHSGVDRPRQRALAALCSLFVGIAVLAAPTGARSELVPGGDSDGIPEEVVWSLSLGGSELSADTEDLEFFEDGCL